MDFARHVRHGSTPITVTLMGIDASIPLRAFGNGGGGSLSNPMGQMQDFVQMQRQMEVLKAQQREAQKQQDIQRIVQQSGGDWDRAIDAMLGRGYGEEASKLRTEIEQGRGHAALALNREFATNLAKFDLAKQMLTGIDDMPEELRGPRYAVIREVGLQLGQGVPGIEQLFPEAYDPAAVDQLLQTSEKGTQYYTARLAALKALGSGDLHTSLALGLAGSESPEIWKETIDGFRQLAGSKLGDPIIAQFGTEFSPESLEKARSFLTQPRTPEQAQGQARVEETQRSNVAGEALQARGQDIGASTAIRGQDVSAATQRRGQDIGAATAIRGQDLTDARAKAEGAGGAKLSVAAIEKIAGVDQALSMIGDIETAFPNMTGRIGPLQGRVTSARLVTGAGVDQPLAEFAAQITGLKNNVIKAITGAQMSEPEAKRIMGQVPDLNNPDEVFKARLATTKRNLELLKRRTIELSGGTVAPNPSSGGGERVRVRGPNGQTGTAPANSALPPGWTVIR